MKNISELILALSSLKNRNYFFITENLENTEQTEKKLGLKFPDAISKFYSIYNGGFIPNSLISEKKINDGRFYDEIEWESNAFLNLEDILYYYNLEKENAINFKQEEHLNSKRLIPFFRTKQQELLVFTENSLILRAKEMDNNEISWIHLYQNFESLLNEYIKNKGEISL
ncbi:SMI1/KNR4 family protein SUKH-1 [Flavobacterium sp. 270]|uniref:SMI1/KNR4 family protein n=1 Tax=Flavobacterium sp. 270 TaxID=2512114 RepID=UPI0010669DB1|nr:SMI1/KNR4 family protein [Flavobacterium sp. 270]TDW46994.1 SMI1/KNR4 family protein SUKH-1 [Flavobacterium sp. 270]